MNSVQEDVKHATDIAGSRSTTHSPLARAIRPEEHIFVSHHTQKDISGAETFKVESQDAVRCVVSP